MVHQGCCKEEISYHEQCTPNGVGHFMVRKHQQVEMKRLFRVLEFFKISVCQNMIKFSSNMLQFSNFGML
jgi:hypothetical protein